MKVYLIRHGKTKGNEEHRYVGSTEEGLLLSARWELLKKSVPLADKVYVSPKRRCLETAELLYPGRQVVVIDKLQECDFGAFEYRNYQELNGNPEYQQFIDTLGKSGFPGGEDRDTFQRRCVLGFEQAMEDCRGCEAAAFVVHGGTIMAVLDRYARPHKDYYEWQVKNGSGFAAEAVWAENGKDFYLEHIVEI